MSKPFDWVLIGGVLLVIAAGVFYTWRAQQSSLRWPSTPGVVLSSRIVETNDGETNGDSSRRFWVELEYEYTVAGRRWVGTRIRIVALGHTTQQAAQVELAAYPVGAKIAVFYDPAKPQACVLIKG